MDANLAEQSGPKASTANCVAATIIYATWH